MGLQGFTYNGHRGHDSDILSFKEQAVGVSEIRTSSAASVTAELRWKTSYELPPDTMLNYPLLLNLIETEVVGGQPYPDCCSAWRDLLDHAVRIVALEGPLWLLRSKQHLRRCLTR